MLLFGHWLINRQMKLATVVDCWLSGMRDNRVAETVSHLRSELGCSQFSFLLKTYCAAVVMTLITPVFIIGSDVDRGSSLSSESIDR